MSADSRLLLKILSPRLVAKALLLLDRSTAIVVSVCWLAALVTLILAAFAVHGAVSAKKDAATAVVGEPVLPTASTSPIDGREGQAIVERMQRQFPDLKIDIDASRAITIRTEDGAKFHQWISALGYIDTMAPEYHWAINDFCVGHCGQELMRASVVGQKVAFRLPPPQ